MRGLDALGLCRRERTLSVAIGGSPPDRAGRPIDQRRSESRPLTRSFLSRSRVATSSSAPARSACSSVAASIDGLEARDFDIVNSSGERVVGGVLFLHWFDPQADDGNKTQFAAAGAGSCRAWRGVRPPATCIPVGRRTRRFERVDARQIEAELARLGIAVDAAGGAGASG